MVATHLPMANDSTATRTPNQMKVRPNAYTTGRLKLAPPL